MTSLQAALDLDDRDRVLRLPVSDEDAQVLDLVDAWPNTLARLGLGISTGPVVPFRARTLVDREGRVPQTHVPLLWMNHVRPMQITWPLHRHKPEYIKRQGAEALLLPNRNYVLMRRFTAKEEARRLSAAPYLARSLSVPRVGVENHLNYIYRCAGSLSDEEAWGLAALYNSRLLDTYFRCLNGNTQVNATELRAMPLPAHDTIVALGERVRQLADPLENLDRLIADILSAGIPRKVAVGQHRRGAENPQGLGDAASAVESAAEAGVLCWATGGRRLVHSTRGLARGRPSFRTLLSARSPCVSSVSRVP